MTETQCSLLRRIFANILICRILLQSTEVQTIQLSPGTVRAPAARAPARSGLHALQFPQDLYKEEPVALSWIPV